MPSADRDPSPFPIDERHPHQDEGEDGGHEPEDEHWPPCTGGIDGSRAPEDRRIEAEIGEAARQRNRRVRRDGLEHDGEVRRPYLDDRPVDPRISLAKRDQLVAATGGDEVSDDDGASRRTDGEVDLHRCLSDPTAARLGVSERRSDGGGEDDGEDDGAHLASVSAFVSPPLDGPFDSLSE